MSLSHSQPEVHDFANVTLKSKAYQVLYKFVLARDTYLFWMVQDGDGIVEDEESDRETQLLQIEWQTMKAIEQTQMIQQASAAKNSHLLLQDTVP